MKANMRRSAPLNPSKRHSARRWGYAILESQLSKDIFFLRKLDPRSAVVKALKYLPKSKSQLRQDLFVLSQLDFKINGYFVDFCATNGIDLSNTYLLEKEFHWTGILAEPAKCWHEALRKNRSADIETSCVWKDSGSTLLFNEVDGAEFSTIKDFSGSDLHANRRKHGREYEIRTISLIDLLEKYKAPQVIDYLSIDTEGSEFMILENFDFGKYQFRVITCEHNYTPMRDKIFELLTEHGYTRVSQKISGFDDWYVIT